jgi:hypothetical protein
MTERPDPLAPPEGYGRKKPDGSGAIDDGSVPYPVACSVHAGGKQCRARLAVVIWYGDAAEHVGPVGYCMSHGMLAGRAEASCSVCSQPMQILKTEPVGELAAASVAYGSLQAQLDKLGLRDHGRP